MTYESDDDEKRKNHLMIDVMNGALVYACAV